MPLHYHRTIPEVFAEACQEFSASAVFTCMGHTMSFQELDELSGKFAAYLQQHTNLKPGDRIAIQLPNVLQYPIAVLVLCAQALLW